MSDNSVQDQSTPAPGANVSSEGPGMSTTQTLTSILFEPGETFESLRDRPRFLVAGLITVLLFMAYYVTFVSRVGTETIARAQIESRAPDASPDQIEQQLQIQNNPIVKVITYGSFPIVFAILFSAGAALYLLGAMMMAKGMTFKQALAVWVYSSYAPMLVFALINIILLFLKSPDDIDPLAINHGIAKANPSFLLDSKAQPVLATLLGSFDLIQFFGLFLAALGLRRIAKMSSGSAWAVVLAIWIFGIVIRVALASIMGSAM